MRPGRIKHKARARHRRIAVTCAGVSALTVMGGTAAFATEGGSWHPHDGDASLDNGGSAWADVNQYSGVYTQQLGHANTGANHAISIVGNVNLGHQDCLTYLDGGNVDNSEDNNTAGNNGGNCTNDGTATNDGTGKALVHTGNANAANSAAASVSQSNGGDAAANNTANDNDVTADDGNASLSNGGDAHLSVNQQSSVDTWQGASANSGHNTAISGVVGINVGSQIGTTTVGGGNVHWSDDGNTAGNTGGNASNTSNASNTGNGTASITTGNANAANSSTTTVNQSNTGSATSTNTANGNTVTSD
jgi:hypothetical protein